MAAKYSNVTGYVVGERVAARCWLTHVNGLTGHTGHYCKAGERLTVVAVGPVGVTVERADGARALTSSGEVRRVGKKV